MSNFDIKKLEFDKLLAIIAADAIIDSSAEYINKLEPSGDSFMANKLLLDTDCCVKILSAYGGPPIRGVGNCLAAAQRAKIGAVLSLRELLLVGDLLKVSRETQKFRDNNLPGKYPIDRFFNRLAVNVILEKSITDSIISADELADSASPELQNIRRKIMRKGDEVRERLEGIIRSASYSLFLQEAIITMRDGRYVVPVKSEHRGKISGIVHDTSASGATVFVEPMPVVEANNAVKILRAEEKEEVERIIAQLSADVSDYAGFIIDGYEALTRLDVAFAIGRYALKTNSVMPLLSDEINLRDARHPLIPKDEVVPISVRIGGDYTTLVVTGPNTGGKTVCLKTIGLLSIMAQCGIFIPAKEKSSIPILDGIFADIGDEQSIEQSLSTFSSHMKNIVSILDRATKNTLVLLDELGAGTDPVEGAALAVSILENLKNQGALVCATTHYSEIKMYALENDHVENASCEFDVDTLRPTYRLITGIPGKSNAFAIASRLGLGDDIISHAGTVMSLEDKRFEKMATSLEKKRIEMENEIEGVRSDKAENERIRAEALEFKKKTVADADRILADAKLKSDDMVAKLRNEAELLKYEIEDIRKAAKKDGQTAAQRARDLLRKEITGLESGREKPGKSIADSEYKLPRPLVVGDTVKIMSFGTTGTVSEISKKDNSALIVAGNMRTKISFDDLRLVETKAKTKNKSGTRKTTASKASSNVNTSVDIRGLNVDEGILDVDRFLSNSILLDLSEVMIIHGVGTGALKSGIRRHLKTLKHVKNFRRGKYGEGEDGVTIVTLK